jgi:hypothetical protein
LLSVYKYQNAPALFFILFAHLKIAKPFSLCRDLFCIAYKPLHVVRPKYESVRGYWDKFGVLGTMVNDNSGWRTEFSFGAYHRATPDLTLLISSSRQ